MAPQKSPDFCHLGYCFSQDTGFYYLQSRYYDPTTCRNNPIRRVDIAGTADADCYDNDPLDEEDRLEIGRGGGGGPSTGTSPSTSYTSGGSRRASSTAYTNGSSKRAISASSKSKPSEIPPKHRWCWNILKTIKCIRLKITRVEESMRMMGEMAGKNCLMREHLIANMILTLNCQT